MQKRKRDMHEYHAPERVRKLKGLATKLDANDLFHLGLWLRDEQSAHGQAEHLTKCQGIFADMQTWPPGKAMQVARDFLLYQGGRLTPGERLTFKAIHKGRKHIGAWFTRDNGEQVWFHLLRLDDFQPWDGKVLTNAEEQRSAELAQAFGAMMAERLER